VKERSGERPEGNHGYCDTETRVNQTDSCSQLSVSLLDSDAVLRTIRCGLNCSTTGDHIEYEDYQCKHEQSMNERAANMGEHTDQPEQN
jgi:hypothetical protein